MNTEHFVPTEIISSISEPDQGQGSLQSGSSDSAISNLPSFCSIDAMAIGIKKHIPQNAVGGLSGEFGRTGGIRVVILSILAV
jgi:hypothetical protein